MAKTDLETGSKARNLHDTTKTFFACYSIVQLTNVFFVVSNIRWIWHKGDVISDVFLSSCLCWWIIVSRYPHHSCLFVALDSIAFFLENASSGMHAEIINVSRYEAPRYIFATALIRKFSQPFSQLLIRTCRPISHWPWRYQNMW